MLFQYLRGAGEEGGASEVLAASVGIPFPQISSVSSSSEQAWCSQGD